MNSENKNLLLLHFTVFVWGFTAILGQLIQIKALELVWYRMLIAFISLLVFQVLRKKFELPPLKKMLKLGAIGAIVALHWFFFYHTIKISNISLALITLSASALFAGILGPLLNKSKISKLDIATGILIIIGVALIFHFESDKYWGIITGLISALSATVFTLYNEQEIKFGNAINIAIFEMIGGFICLSLYLLIFGFSTESGFSISSSDLFYLLIMGIVCTGFAYVAGITVMKKVTAFNVILTTNLEPVYGILLALLIFGESERMTGGFYLGATVILSAVFIYPFFKKKSLMRKNAKTEISKILE